MKVMGVDFGRSRIGIAFGETEFGIATARPPLIATGTLAKDAEAIAVMARREEATTVVLGLPLIDGEETKGSKIVRRLGNLIAAHGLLTAYVDEAWTTSETHEALIAEGVRASERKGIIDSESAARILMRYFAENA